MLLGPGGMAFPGFDKLAGDSEYAGAAPMTPAAGNLPTGPGYATGPSHVTGQELQAIQQANALAIQQNQQEQRRVNWLVGGVIVGAVGLGLFAWWKSRQG